MNLFKNIYARIKNNYFWKSVATLSIGQIISQLINLLSVPIISRLYSQEAFGAFGIVTSTATIIIGFVGMGLSSAIMAADNDEESQTVFRVNFIIQIILATILCAVMVAIMPFYKSFDVPIGYLPAIFIMYVYIILSILSSLLNVYINRLKMNKVLFVNPLIGALCTLFVTLPLGMIGMDSTGLYIANIISLIIINIHMLTKVNPFKKHTSMQEIKLIFKKYKDFVIYQYPANLMGTFSNQMPAQILVSNYKIAALGDYSMSNKIFSLPSSLIAAPIQIIYFRTATQKFKDGEDISGFTYSLITKIMIIAFIPVIITMSFGEQIFSFILGEKWANAGRLSSILTLQYLFSFCYSCVIYCRVAIQKQKINLIISIIQFIIIISSLLIGTMVYKSFIAAIFCFAVANTILNIINLAVNFYCLKKYTFKFVMFAIAYCLVSIGCALLLSNLHLMKI